MTTTTATQPTILAVAVWRDASGSVTEWPQATRDNRHSRVIARINRWMGESPRNLRIFHGPEAGKQARSYGEALLQHPSNR
jgi:hypothetical protein